MRFTNLFLMIATGLATSAAAKSADQNPLLHAGNRIYLPADDSQEVNYVVHRGQKEGPKFNAPLLWIEYLSEPGVKAKKLRIKSQANLAVPATPSSETKSEGKKEEASGTDNEP